MFVALMEKVSVFMGKNGPNINQIHEETVINDCLQTVCDVRRFIKVDLSNTFIFVDKQDPPLTQSIVINIFLQRHFRVAVTINYVDIVEGRWIGPSQWH